MHAACARGTRLDRLYLGEECLLGQCPLVHLANLLLGSNDPVHEHRGWKQERGRNDDEARREIGDEGVLRPQLHVAEGPVRGRQPEDDEVDRDRLRRQLNVWVVDDIAEGFADRLEDLVHAPCAEPPGSGLSKWLAPYDGRGRRDVRRSVSGANGPLDA